MRRDQLEHAIRTACQIIDRSEFSIDGVDLLTSALPEGWRDRLIKVQNANTAAPSGEPQFTGWCLDKEDLRVAKLCALREKDRNFGSALRQGRRRPRSRLRDHRGAAASQLGDELIGWSRTGDGCVALPASGSNPLATSGAWRECRSAVTRSP